MRIAIIPARGGSKRIPRKNIKSFCGKPVIAWSIEAAQQSRCFDRIVVSTDDEDIAGVARSFGAEVPFLRPRELSDDHTGVIRVVKHSIEWTQDNGLAPTEVCCIFATAPLLDAADVNLGLASLVASDCDYVFTATSYGFPIQRAIKVCGDGKVAMFDPQHVQTRSQDLEHAYHDAGQFYWGRHDAWLEERPIFGDSSRAILLPRHRVQDIDTQEDWTRAEWLFRAMRAESC